MAKVDDKVCYPRSRSTEFTVKNVVPDHEDDGETHLYLVGHGTAFWVREREVTVEGSSWRSFRQKFWSGYREGIKEGIVTVLILAGAVFVGRACLDGGLPSINAVVVAVGSAIVAMKIWGCR